MAEYIDREKVLYRMAKQATIDGQPRAIRRAMKIVAEFPQSDVVERKRGEWNWVGFNIECSECGAMPNFDSTELLYNFCPNCGADMRGER